MIDGSRKWIGVVLVVAGVALPSVRFGRESLAVDRCLDSGGSYNYRLHACDLQASHPVLPFSSRHGGLLLGGAALAVYGLLAARRYRPSG